MKQYMMVSKRLALFLVFLLGNFFLSASIRCEESNTTQQTVPNEIPLPTPQSHYETFKSGLSGLPLLRELTKDLDPETQKTILTFVAVSGFLRNDVVSDINSPE